MAGFVDIACNFTHESFKDDLETVIADAENMGVEKFVLLCASKLCRGQTLQLLRIHLTFVVNNCLGNLGTLVCA